MFSRSLVVAALAAPFIGVLADVCTRTYTVKAGDWCDKISASQNVSTYQLAAVNAGTINSQCDNLLPDQEICLGTEGKDCKDTYVVAPNDTCEKIQETFGINATTLYGNNQIIDSECSNIYIGEVLCVAKIIAAPALSSNIAVPARAKPTAATIPAPAPPQDAPQEPVDCPEGFELVWEDE